MKANIPKSWLTLPEKEKQIIYKLVEDQFNKTIDHEEAELQKGGYSLLALFCIDRKTHSARCVVWHF